MSTTSATTSATSSAASSTATPDALTPSTGSQTLSQNDFLNLLVAQMKAQDPLNPQTDTAMAAQMAQFTALQQTGTMSNNIATLLTQQQLSQANGMLGNTVSLQADSNTVVSGVVQSVQISGGTPQIVVNNQAYNLSQVLSISPTAATAATAAATSVPAIPPADRSTAAP